MDKRWIEGVDVTAETHDLLLDVMQKKSATSLTQLQKLFWQEQAKAFQSKERGMRWHPMMLRLAILIHSRSAQAYETLRATGILQLPSESTLRDYTNVFHPKPGFQKSAIDEIIRQTKDFKDEQRYVALLHDEMSIKADLVYDKRSGELVGFVSKDDHDQTLATHALVFFSCCKEYIIHLIVFNRVMINKFV